MGILKTTALTVFILLGCFSFAYIGFEFGYNTCKEEAVKEFEAIFEQGLNEGFSQGFEEGKKTSGRL